MVKTLKLFVISFPFFYFYNFLLSSSNSNIAYYVVKQKDTLYSLSKKLRNDQNDLRKLNGLVGKNIIKIGDKLKYYKNVTYNKTVHFKKPTQNSSRIKREFNSNLSSPHNGLEFRPSNNSSSVTSISNGKVVVVSNMRGYDKYVIIQHENDFISVYANLEEVKVKEGQIIKQSQYLGVVKKNKGLYFQLNYKSTPVNPKTYIHFT